MEDGNKAKEQLINELVLLRQRIKRLETLEAEHKQMYETLQRDRNMALNYLNVADVIIVAINNIIPPNMNNPPNDITLDFFATIDS